MVVVMYDGEVDEVLHCSSIEHAVIIMNAQVDATEEMSLARLNSLGYTFIKKQGKTPSDHCERLIELESKGYKVDHLRIYGV